MHPFWDGNGRLHRFLIHYTLSKQGFTLEGIVFSVSSVMLRMHKEYNRVLEYFSRPLNELIRGYQLDEQAEMTVTQKTITQLLSSYIIVWNKPFILISKES